MPQQESIEKKRLPLLSMRGISKAFTGVLANDSIDFDIYSSEIHALLGENGAGKSTLVKILYGFYHSDSGKIFQNGKELPILSPYHARVAQIGMVFQDFSLIPAFTVAENIALFLPNLKPTLNFKEIDRHIKELSERYDLKVDPQAKVSQLSIGEQQKVEILKLLLADARVLILDEPTRVLAHHEIKALFQMLSNLRKDGYAIILITHKMRDVLNCADRITILRNGRVAGTLLQSEASEEKLVAMMFGVEISRLEVHPSNRVSESKIPVFELTGIETRGEGAETSLKNIDLQIYPNEIVGVAGVSGNGQKELGDVALGMIKSIKGKKILFGKDSTNLSIQEIRKSGVGFIPENPLTMAVVPFMSVLENMALTKTRFYSQLGGLRMDWLKIKTDLDTTLKKFGFTLPFFVPARSLSGGNLQRMVIVREMAHEPRLIIASYLTRGLDVQSTIAARQALLKAKESGAGVLLISEDLDELFTLSDRLLVLFNGKIVGDCKPEETDIFEIGHLMTGSEVPYVTN